MSHDLFVASQAAENRGRFAGHRLEQRHLHAVARRDRDRHVSHAVKGGHVVVNQFAGEPDVVADAELIGAAHDLVAICRVFGVLGHDQYCIGEGPTNDDHRLDDA